MRYLVHYKSWEQDYIEEMLGTLKEHRKIKLSKIYLRKQCQSLNREQCDIEEEKKNS